jgi:hypothetical protein
MSAKGAIFIPLLYVPGGPSSGLEIVFSFWGAAKLCLARGAQRLVWRVDEPKKTAMRSARARTSVLTPLVVSERLLLRYEQIILLRHFNSLHGIPFRSELRNWLFRGTRNASE